MLQERNIEECYANIFRCLNSIKINNCYDVNSPYNKFCYFRCYRMNYDIILMYNDEFSF